GEGRAGEHEARCSESENRKKKLVAHVSSELLDCSPSRPVIRLVSSIFCSHFRLSFKLTLPRQDKRPPRAPCRNLGLSGDGGRRPPSYEEQTVLEDKERARRPRSGRLFTRPAASLPLAPQKSPRCVGRPPAAACRRADRHART